jgi:predicted DNA binding CopG/RHH family protein
MYGTPKDNNDKRLNRITVTLSCSDMETVEEIADAKGMSNSEVINLLIKPTIRNILEQKELIVTNPMAVAFDLMTKG